MVGGPDRPLPWCEGPKLVPFNFQGHDESIIFKKPIGSAVHSHVFEVIIGGATFKLLNTRTYWPYRGIELAPLSRKDLFHHKDPFYSECRTFGRLKEAGREDLAVRCYGYIVVNSKHEEDVLRQFRIASWDRGKSDEGKPVRAIVKELIHSDQPFVTKMIPRMMRDLRAINSLGIQVWDVKDDMYLGGSLLDLSHPRTVPHIQLDLQSGIWERDHIMSEGTRDLTRR